MSEDRVKVFGRVYGKVQNVMFRQTLMRGAMKRGVVAGATNVKSDKTRVDFTLEGPAEKVNEMIEVMKSGNALNSWGAKVNTFEQLESGKEALTHEVNTKNVESIKWKKGVKFYL